MYLQFKTETPLNVSVLAPTDSKTNFIANPVKHKQNINNNRFHINRYRPLLTKVNKETETITIKQEISQKQYNLIW